MTSRSKVKNSKLWSKKEDATLRIIAKKIYKFALSPLIKAKDYFKELKFPLIDARSMYATERSQSVKRWLKRPELRIKKMYIS